MTPAAPKPTGFDAVIETVARYVEAFDDGPITTKAAKSWFAKEIRALAGRTQPTGRDEIQRTVVDWGARCFGEDHMRNKIVRAARFIEEAAELVQAVGLPKDHAQRALDYVYCRPAGDPAQELGGVSNTQYALAGALGLSVADCEAKEIARCLAKTPEHFAQRNRDKIEKIDAAQPTGDAEGLVERATKFIVEEMPSVSNPVCTCAGNTVCLHHKAGLLVIDLRDALRSTNSRLAVQAKDEDEAYEIGKRDGYESAIQDLDIATGGDGEFFGSTVPGRTVDLPVMKQRVIDRLVPDEGGWLIEVGGNAGHAIEYFDGLGWSADHLEAVRFARKADAERVVVGLDHVLEMRVAEHAWIPGKARAALSTVAGEEKKDGR